MKDISHTVDLNKSHTIIIHVSTKFTQDAIGCLWVAIRKTNMWKMHLLSDLSEYRNDFVAMELICVYVYNNAILQGCFRLYHWFSVQIKLD